MTIGRKMKSIVLPEEETQVEELTSDSSPKLGIEALRFTVSSREKRLGFEHPQTLAAAMELADECRESDLDEEAEALYRKVLNARQSARPDDPETLVSALCLANVVRRRATREGKEKSELWAESEALYRQTVEAYRRLVGAADRSTATAVYSLTRGLVARGDFDAAEKELRLLLAQQEAARGPVALEVCWTSHVLGWTLWKKKDYAAAAILYQRAYGGRRSMLGDSNELTKASLSQMLRCLEASSAPKSGGEQCRFRSRQ